MKLFFSKKKMIRLTLMVLETSCPSFPVELHYWGKSHGLQL